MTRNHQDVIDRVSVMWAFTAAFIAFMAGVWVGTLAYSMPFQNETTPESVYQGMTPASDWGAFEIKLEE